MCIYMYAHTHTCVYAWYFPPPPESIHHHALLLRFPRTNQISNISSSPIPSTPGHRQARTASTFIRWWMGCRDGKGGVRVTNSNQGAPLGGYQWATSWNICRQVIHHGTQLRVCVCGNDGPGLRCEAGGRTCHDTLWAFHRSVLSLHDRTDKK